VPCDVEIKTPHYNRTARAHRHSRTGPPPATGPRLGRRQGFFFAPDKGLGSLDDTWMTESRLVRVRERALEAGPRAGAHWVF
jgi:hypothetical protein